MIFVFLEPAFCILEQIPLQFVLYDRISWRILVKCWQITYFLMCKNRWLWNYCSILQVLQLEFRLKKQLGVNTFFSMKWQMSWVRLFFGIELYSITFIQHLWTMEAIITPTSPEICWEKKRFDRPHFLWCPPPTYPSKVRESAPLFWYCTLMHSVQCKLNGSKLLIQLGYDLYF